MSQFKLIAIDMDGTLLNSNLEISPRTAQAIRRVRERGVHVTFCTGRMYASALPYAQAMELEIPLVTHDGAYVKHLGTGEILYHKPLPAPYAKHIFLKAKEKGIHVNVVTEELLCMEQITAIGKRYAEIEGVPINVVEDMLGFLEQDPVNMTLVAEPQVLVEVARELEEELGDKIYMTKSAPYYLELMHPEATKGRGLQAVAEYLGIPRKQVMGIGDNYNDLEMFKYSGFAVAMGNAEEEVKRHADYVTGSNDEDGVAEVLEKFVLSR